METLFCSSLLKSNLCWRNLKVQHERKTHPKCHSSRYFHTLWLLNFLNKYLIYKNLCLVTKASLSNTVNWHFWHNLHNCMIALLGYGFVGIYTIKDDVIKTVDYFLKVLLKSLFYVDSPGWWFYYVSFCFVQTITNLLWF